MNKLTPEQKRLIRRRAIQTGIALGVVNYFFLVRRLNRIEQKIDNLASIEGEIVELMGLAIKA